MKLLSALLGTLLLFSTATPALAVPEPPTPPQAPSAPEAHQIPEVTGDYPDPINPNIRVHVFVHDFNKFNRTPILVCSDNDSSTTDGVTGWHLPANVTYSLNTSSVPSAIDASNLATLANNAYQTWQTAVSGKVNFIRGADTTTSRSAYDGQNIVAWGRTSGTALAVTYTRYYVSSGQVVDVDTIFNKKFPWSFTPYSSNSCGDPSSYDAQDILTHELGHWMGLDDEYLSSYVDNTMYGYGSTGEIKKDTLTSGDISAVRSIYP